MHSQSERFRTTGARVAGADSTPLPEGACKPMCVGAVPDPCSFFLRTGVVRCLAEQFKKTFWNGSDFHAF